MDIHEQITKACAALGVTLVGGHTEITYGLTRPIVSGSDARGSHPRHRRLARRARVSGDAIILTQGIAIEGTSVLAHEAADTLRAGGMSQGEVSAAAGLLDAPGISVVRAARAAAKAGVTAMHDPTEGGLVTGLAELATAANAGLEVDECGGARAARDAGGVPGAGAGPAGAAGLGVAAGGGGAGAD